ncbi:hypothetical protein DS745_15975 [Anaerobacillus alkaliphilus]|uniref:Uncharacterized protein n=1 Tax=Anaerobacillus alkaliphilus TaxID=1548597 RepID=A0A4Q0VNV3_9BACI|nr:hypothetical protein [Anaerobacillus alkaliphilus]RXI97858.1 hypothetical protein DS745_15975 [Anaerobacillus alkaliphilus]
MSKTKHYFLDGNTSKGYVTLVDQLVNSINNIHVVKGNLGNEKTALFQSIGDKYEQQGLAVQFLHNPSNEENLDGVIIPEKSLAVLDGSGKNGLEAKYSNFIKGVYDLDAALDKVKLLINKNTIINMNKDIQQLHEEAYAKFAKGKEIHETKEELYIAAMDFDKANKVIAQLAANLFHDVTVPQESPIVKELFFGAATPNGAVNYIDNITSDIDKRYIIKGRSGSGKSTLMRRIGKYAENVGLSVQYFPCGLDPNSLDMIIIPTLSVAILDGTAPHVIDPTRAKDEVIDMFELCMDQSVDSKYQEEFEQLQVAYKQEMKVGTKLLQEAKNARNDLEQLYRDAVNQDELSEIINRIITSTTN